MGPSPPYCRTRWRPPRPLDPRPPVPGLHPPSLPHDLPPAPVVALDADGEPDAEQMSISRRLRQPRTIISIAVPLGIIAAFFAINGEVLATVPGLVLAADPALVLLAFVVFYLGFPLRGRRWAILLQGTGLRISTKDSTEIIFLSWLVNCVVPAKLGDVYRAYLLKINSTGVSLSRTFGTVFMERVLDVFALALLGLAAGYWSFRSGLPPAIQVVFGVGVVVIGILAVGLFTMRNFGRRIIVALPLPHVVRDFYDRFEEGVFGAMVVRQHAHPRLPDRPDLADRGAAPVPGGPGARVRGRLARAVGGDLRRADRLAADRRAAQPRRPGHRRSRRRSASCTSAMACRCPRRPRSRCSIGSSASSRSSCSARSSTSSRRCRAASGTIAGPVAAPARTVTPA